jgi:hypothetical protein
MASSIDCITHGLHNVEVCDYLSVKREFGDWVITTAFYASLHLISSIIFPLRIPQKNGSELLCNNIDEYKRHKGGIHSKHTLICDLVFEKCSKDIGEKYKWLYDTCINARYVNYQQGYEIAACARSRMVAVRDYVLKQHNALKKM